MRQFGFFDWENLAYLTALIQVLCMMSLDASAKSSQELGPIHLHYSDRPPYAISGNSPMKEGSAPSGVVADPSAQAFQMAKIPFVWEKTPVNRQFAIIKENRGRDCAIGFERIPNREAFANFTDPLYIGQPVVAITSLQIKEKDGVSLETMLSKYSIIVKENFTQGAALTEQISKSSKKYVTSVDSQQMVQMVALGRADFMLISNDELEYYVEHKVIDAGSVRLLRLADVNLRFKRRIMCNKALGMSLIKKLNRSIEKLHVQPAPFKNVIHH
jgi:uncharacterized protein (TIGR02285 family)